MKYQIIDEINHNDVQKEKERKHLKNLSDYNSNKDKIYQFPKKYYHKDKTNTKEISNKNNNHQNIIPHGYVTWW